MNRSSLTWRLAFGFSLLLVVALLGYKIYLNYFERDFVAVHASQVARIKSSLAGKEHFRFAVVGNINNSIGIFERKIIPQLNAAQLDFVVSAGNSVSGNGEDKYRALYRSLQNLKIPYLLTFGENEYTRFGAYRYYDHFGPFHFAFKAGNSLFLFLDSSGHTHPSWQLSWLEQQLQASTADEHVFIFSGHPLKPVDLTGLLEFDDDYLMETVMREATAGLIESHGATAVFSSNLPIYAQQRHGQTDYVLTGGAGGLVLNTERSYYHYVIVEVNGERVTITPVSLDIGQHPFWRVVESLWMFFHSLFYVGYLNFLLLLASLSVVLLGLGRLIFAERDYYPDFDLDASAWLQRPLKIAHFTNNYLPFIGGVPLSIARLCQGLRQQGDEVLVVAPSYNEGESDEGVVRVPTLRPTGESQQFRLANILSRKPWKALAIFQPDVIHVHHPFWLGSLGLFMARRRKIPVVFTYHTRLEHYAHNVRLPGPLFRNLISHALVRRFANRCDAIVVPTASTEEYLRLIGVKRPVYVQPTGIDVSAFDAVVPAEVETLRKRLGLEGKRVMITVSRLSREKNLEFMLEGLAPLLRQHPDWHVLQIGDGPLREELAQQIRQLGLEQQWQLLGAVEPTALPAHYRLAELFIFASRSETQGMVILEAMAAHLPVVVVRSSGIDDVVADGDNGYKTPLNRDVWRRRIAEIMANAELREHLAEQAYTLARQHDIPEFGAALHHIYAEVLASQHHAVLPAVDNSCH